MKLFIFLTILIFLGYASADLEIGLQHCSYEYSRYCRDVIKKHTILFKAAESTCESGEEVNYVPSCLSRVGGNYSNNSTCRETGPDFCSQSPRCIPDCLSRAANGYSYAGQCKEYGEDICS